LCFTWRDTAGEIWLLKIVTNSHAKAGEFYNKVLCLSLILTGVSRQVESLNHAYEDLCLPNVSVEAINTPMASH